MSETNKAVTIKDIAKECGVTATTVSLALRNHPRISDATKAKVREAADRLSYRRNPMVSALMASISQSHAPIAQFPLAVVYGHDFSEIKSNTFHWKLWQGMEHRASALGFKLERFHVGQNKLTAKRLSQILIARGIGGVLIPPLKKEGGHVNLDWNAFSAIAIGYSMLSPDLHRVSPDQYRGIRLALRMLTQMGYTRPGLVLNSKKELRTIHIRSSGFYGFEYAQKSRGIIPVLACEEVGQSDLQKWYKKYTPDVIISSDRDIIAPLKGLGLKYPDDVGLLTLSCEDPEEDVAGVDQNPHLVGAAAIDQLVHMIYYNKCGIPDLSYVVQVPPIWKDGQSICKQDKK